MIATQANGAKEELVFKVLHEQAPAKAGVVFWIGASGETFYWHDLMRVSYDPSPEDESEERITMLFRLCDIIIQGYNLRDLFLHCQTCRVDWLKTSSRDAIMRGKGPIVASIEIEEPKVKKH
jgi:hypothetical protein